MTREEAKKEALLLPLYDKDDCESVCGLLDMIYDNFEATIEAQEIIIRDKTAFMEAMAQPKTCEGCRWLPNKDEYGMTLCSHKYACVRQESEDYYELKAQL